MNTDIIKKYSHLFLAFLALSQVVLIFMVYNLTQAVKEVKDDVKGVGYTAARAYTMASDAYNAASDARDYAADASDYAANASDYAESAANSASNAEDYSSDIYYRIGY